MWKRSDDDSWRNTLRSVAVYSDADPDAAHELPRGMVPTYGALWDIDVVYGPHGAPDFFTDEDIATFFATAWEVHYNSSRTGVRLIGPKPQWARSDGGEAGLHPSNIHDCACAIGSVDFAGDMPVILGPDGPSLGGFVCPATIVQSELWKVGQLRPGDRVRFHCISAAEAACREQTQIVLDLNLRFRVHALMTSLQQAGIPGILDFTPGIRSLQVHYDSAIISRAKLMDALEAAENELPAIDPMRVPRRIVHLPLPWDDPATRLAIEKYTQSVRRDAPWCPSNNEFIRRINGLDPIDAVREIVFGASCPVMGLGDAYLGAPVATPLDPRHRLVTTKCNPARTWTPENAVGIGGAYPCVYGMEGPGGYQFVGRTVQMWNGHHQSADFVEGKRWLLRFFDQIRFHPVGADELLHLREDFPQGRYKLRIEETELDLAAIAVPAGSRADGLPFGVTPFAPAFSDRALLELGARWQQGCGKRSLRANAQQGRSRRNGSAARHRSRRNRRGAAQSRGSSAAARRERTGAGSRESKTPGIHAAVERFLLEALAPTVEEEMPLAAEAVGASISEAGTAKDGKAGR